MGGKKKKNSGKGQKNYNKIKKKRFQDLKYKSRRELLLSAFEDELEVWFGDNEEKIKNFGDFLIKQEELFAEEAYEDLFSGDSYYEEKLQQLKGQKCHGINEALEILDKMAKVNKKIAKGKKYKKLYKRKDLGIATYLNSDRYKKKLLNKNKYRKELSKIAKRERKELNEMRKLGYIKSKDPDKELNKILKANKTMSNALSDAYIQKHFID